MARQLDPKVASTLKEFGFDKSAAWDCHGVWVVYHRVLEQIAAQAGVTFSQPTIIEADGGAKIAAICVTGVYKERTEWSIGEAAPGNNKNAYPWAMAEKRAKDRVILKLIGLHGLAYSEEEADDFKKRIEEEPDHRTPEAILNDFLDRVRNIEIGNRADFEFAWNEEKSDLKRIERTAKEAYDKFMTELHRITHERQLNHMGAPEDAPKPRAQQGDNGSGGDSPARLKARELLKAWKASPHLTGLEASLKLAGYLTTSEDGWVVKPDSHLGAIRENEPEVFHTLASEADKLRVTLSKKAAA